MSTQVRGLDLGVVKGALRPDPQIATEPGAPHRGHEYQRGRERPVQAVSRDHGR